MRKQLVGINPRRTRKAVSVSPYSWIFTSVSVGSCSRFYLFTSAVTAIWASPRFRHPHSQTLVTRVSPSHITLAIWVRVRVTVDTHITRVLGMGMPISLWAYPICHTPLSRTVRGSFAPLQKSRLNQRSYEALSDMVFVLTQELSIRYSVYIA